MSDLACWLGSADASAPSLVVPPGRLPLSLPNVSSRGDEVIFGCAWPSWKVLARLRTDVTWATLSSRENDRENGWGLGRATSVSDEDCVRHILLLLMMRLEADAHVILTVNARLAYGLVAPGIRDVEACVISRVTDS